MTVQLPSWIRGTRAVTGTLGNGVWRRVHDRFARAVRRYHEVIEVIPSRPVRTELEEIALELDEALVMVRLACEAAQCDAPSRGTDVPIAPGDVYFDVHRRLARAATTCARVSEAAMMARVAVRTRDDEAVRDHVDSARRAAKEVRELVDGAFI